MTLEPANYSEPEGVGICANCGREFGDHFECEHLDDGRTYTCGARLCPNEELTEFEERDADWYAEREASRRER